MLSLRSLLINKKVCKRNSVSVVKCQIATKSRRKKLIILGTGWASYKVLKAIDKKLYDVIVVSPRNHFLFTPLLCSTTVGTLEFRSIIEPIRNTGFRQTDHFHLSRATGIDFDKRIVHSESVLKPGLTYDLEYDKLVIGVGSLSNTFGVPGVTEHAFFLKEVGDARRIRNRILCNFELATQSSIAEEESKRLLHVVIVGGGPTGVEFGAEIYDFVEQDVTRLYKAKKDDVRVTLVESNQILSSFDEKLRNYATKKIQERKGFKLEQDTVTAVHKDRVVLKGRGEVPCGLVVWSTGLAPRDFVTKLNIPKNNRGQVAERQGGYLAKELCQPTDEPFKFTSAGMLAYIGSYEGLSDLPQAKLQGFPSWFLWRSAYLTRLGSWRLRMQVPLDWTKTLLFGRDVSRFD